MRDTRITPDPTWPWQVAKVLVLMIGIVAAALLVWQLAHVLLLLFAAVLVAVLLRTAADPIRKYTPLSERWSVALAGLLILAFLMGFLWLVGGQIRSQATALMEDLPDLVEAAENWLGIDGLGSWFEDRRADVLDSGDLMSNMAGYSTTVVSVAFDTLVVLAAGVYLALSPRLYWAGLLKLLPEPRQGDAQDTLQAVGRALKLWLLGQLAAMAMVGTLTALGLWLLDVPSALALGFLAGLLEFVPFVGPLVSAVPAIALAMAESPTTALWVLGLYLLIQQIEGNLITPLVQQHTVDLPPVLTIFAILAFGVLFGPLGVLLATPLAVVCFVLVKKLWVRETLHEEVDLPGEPEVDVPAGAQKDKGG